MSHALDAINEAVDPKRVFRQITRIPDPPAALVQDVIEKYERITGRQNVGAGAQTNPRGETFFYGAFGSRKANRVICTMLVYDRAKGGWRELNTLNDPKLMGEAADPKRVFQSMNAWRQVSHNRSFNQFDGWIIEVWEFESQGNRLQVEKIIEDPQRAPNRAYFKALLRKPDWKRWKVVTLQSRETGETDYGLTFEMARDRAFDWANKAKVGPGPKPIGEAVPPRKQPDPKTFFLKHRPKNPEVEQILQYMPPEFVEAYHQGKEARWENPYSMDSDWWPVNYDDGWSERIFYWDYYTEGGKLFGIVMGGDKDGEHDVQAEAEVGTSEYAQLEENYGSNGWVRAMISYWKSVIESGEDPLGYIHLDTVPVATKFVVGFIKEGDRLKLWGLRNVSNPPSPPAVRWPAVKQKAEEDEDYRRALEYCLVDENGYTQATEENITNDGGKWKGDKLQLKFEWTDPVVVGDQREQLVRIAQGALGELERMQQPRMNEGD